MKTRLKAILGLLSFVLGLGLVLFGVWLLAPPAAYILGGLAILGVVGAAVYEPSNAGNS